MPLHKVTEKERFKATDLMNNRPRKCLGYKTLMEVFSRAMGIDHNINPSVTLTGLNSPKTQFSDKPLIYELLQNADDGLLG